MLNMNQETDSVDF